jgi:hypothetical protein
MRRAVLALLLVLVLAAAGVAAVVVSRDRQEATADPVDEVHAEGLALLIVRTTQGPFAAVVGSTGGSDGVMAVPIEARVTIPGQGDATMRDALQLDPRQAATTVANLLGVWVDHHVDLGRKRLAAVVDRAGGIEVGGETLDGAGTLQLLEEAGDGRNAAFELVLRGLFGAGEVWSPSDLANADSPSSVLQVLESAAGATVASVPIVEAASGVFVAEPEAIRESLVAVFGGPDREVVNVIALNGSGVPGVGELVAEHLAPGGFRIVVSENASEFDHEETLIVVGSADDVALGERVRDLLGTGSVNVSVASGLAPVTIVVGKDFTG